MIQGDSITYINFLIQGIFLNGIGVAGLIGNVISLLVLTRPHMHSSINCLLAGQVVCDSVLIITGALMCGLPSIYIYTGYLFYYFYHMMAHMCSYVTYIAYAARTMSVYLMLCLTVERWVAVCRPFRAKIWCTYSNARRSVLGTAAFSLVYNIPKIFEFGISEIEYNDETIYVAVYNLQFRTETYVVVYIHSLYMIVMYVVPFSALAVLNLGILRQVQRARWERAQMSTVQRREIGLTVMLLVLVLMFFLCNLLPLTINALEVFLGDQVYEYPVLIYISNLLVMIHHSSNFIIYVIFSEKFRSVFLKMFCGATTRNTTFTPLEAIPIRT